MLSNLRSDRQDRGQQATDRTTGAEQTGELLGRPRVRDDRQGGMTQTYSARGGPGEPPPGIRGQQIAAGVGLARRGRPVVSRPGG